MQTETKVTQSVSDIKTLGERIKEFSLSEIIQEIPGNHKMRVISTSLKTGSSNSGGELVMLYTLNKTLDGCYAAIFIDTSIDDQGGQADHKVDLSYFWKDWQELDKFRRWYMGSGDNAWFGEEQIIQFRKICYENNIQKLYMSHGSDTFYRANKKFDRENDKDFSVSIHAIDSWNLAAHIVLGTDL